MAPSPTQERAFKAFVSSTVEDLHAHREAVKQAVLKAGLMPVMCENWLASGDRPPLEKCLQVVSECHVVITLVAHRYGWVPPEQAGREHKSITWLECERAVCEGKELLALMVDERAPWPTEQREEYQATRALLEEAATPERMALIKRSLQKLKEFKGWLNNRGIRAQFRSPEDLYGETLASLVDWHARHAGVDRPPGPADRDEPDPAKALQDVFDQTGFIDIRGLHVGSGKAHRFPIQDLYIPLTSTAEGAADGAAGGGPGTAPGRHLGPRGLQAFLQHRRLAIVGDPGCGKTTFLRNIAYALAATLLNKDPAAAAERLGITDAPPFPVLIRLADLSEFVGRQKRGGEAAPATDDSPEWLVRFLERLAAENAWGLDGKFFRTKFESGACIVLLDGFDEVASARDRERVSALVARCAAVYDRCPMVLTTRPQAYVKDATLPGFVPVQVAPLTEQAIDTFLHRWCSALFPDAPGQAHLHRRELDRALQVRSEIRRMATNPVMLTALAVVHWNERRLPEQRADLYESIIRWLARARENRSGRPPAERCVILLQEIALAMLDQPGGRRVEVPRRWAAEQISDMAEFAGAGDYRIQEAERFLADEELDSGIVVRRGDNLRFWHLSFQEFLAARAMAARPDRRQQELLFADQTRLFSAEWREPVLLYAGVLHGQGPQKVDALLDAVLQGQPPDATLAENARRVGLIGAIQRDLTALSYRVRHPRFDRMLEEVMAIFDPQACQTLSHELRLEAADALGQAGDPRLDLDNWVSIEAGEFWLGAQDGDASALRYDPEAVSIESPAHRVTLGAFQICRFPVTVGEYAQFIADDGYQDQQHWREGGYGLWRLPEQWDNQVPYGNRPVVGVSWYEATAYCRWKGRGARLPTEAQWERAGRGAEGRLFPWGHARPDPARLNFAKSAVGHVTPVGLYPSGATPDGLHDLAGNVFEWCRDWLVYYGGLVDKQTGERVGKDGIRRVVRGGCFRSVAHLVRAAFRGAYRPEYRSNAVGFRVCRMDVVGGA